MHRRALFTCAAVAGLTASAAAVPAQQPAGARRGAPEIELVYEREIFAYPGMDRRDPFLPLTNENEMGPRFESLRLQGIIYSTGRGQSIALLAADGKVFRVRVGDVIGNSTVVEIGPLRVVMAVENFGNIRQEMLELERNQGANR